MSQKVDRRTLRTKKAFKALLVQKLMTKNLEKITVSELTSKAGYSRGTFYLHYTDIFALYQEMEDDVLNGITDIVRECGSADPEVRLEAIIAAVMEYMVEHAQECEALLRTDSASLLSRVFERNRVHEQETWEAPFGSPEHTMAYANIFLGYGIAGILRHWMAYGQLETPQQIAQVVKTILGGYSPFQGS